MNGYSPFLRHFHDLKEVDGNTVLWVGLVRFAQEGICPRSCAVSVVIKVIGVAF